MSYPLLALALVHFHSISISIHFIQANTKQSVILTYPILISLFHFLPTLFHVGSCVPICISAFILRVLAVADTTIIFSESYCRVQSLSLSGKILYPICDRFVVQWPQLLTDYSRAEYPGRMM
jgi:beta-1,4-N-acetylglucosaminyltransferase